MSKILFLNQPAMGHLNTLQRIAAQMQEDGHRIHFLVPGIRDTRPQFQILESAFEVQEVLQKNNFSYDLIPPALTTLPAALILPFRSGYDEITHAINLFSQGIEHYTRHVLKFIEGYRPDVIVTDFAFPASSIAAEYTKTPYIVIYHSGLPFRGEGIPPFGSGLPIGIRKSPILLEYEQKEKRTLQMLDSRINLALQRFGLPPAAPDLLRRPYSPWLNLITSATAAEAPRNNLTPSTFFIGPCYSHRDLNHLPFPFEKLQAHRYKIYISLGINTKAEVFHKMMNALDNPVYQVIISAGGTYPSLQQEPIPKNVLLFKSVPQIELFPKINLSISHGGNNSINEALGSGKPILVISSGGEQGDNASRVEYLGVGLRLDSHQFTESQLLASVEKIRISPVYEARAVAIQKSLETTDGAKSASQCIDWIARKRRPLLRPENVPLTITPDDLKVLLGE